MKEKEQQLWQDIRHHWSMVKAAKAEILRLFDAGELLTSPRLAELSRQVDSHGAQLEALDRQLEALILDEVQ